MRAGQLILDGVDLTVSEGESVAITGPSGSGKTSLLAIVAGLTPPTAGEVRIDGKRVTGLPGPSERVAMVLQGYGLVSLLTAAENIEVALRAAGLPAPEAQTAAAPPWTTWGWARTRARSWRSCPVASSSGSRWPGRWPGSPGC